MHLKERSGLGSSKAAATLWSEGPAIMLSALSVLEVWHCLTLTSHPNEQKPCSCTAVGSNILTTTGLWISCGWEAVWTIATSFQHCTFWFVTKAIPWQKDTGFIGFASWTWVLFVHHISVKTTSKNRVTETCQFKWQCRTFMLVSLSLSNVWAQRQDAFLQAQVVWLVAWRPSLWKLGYFRQPRQIYPFQAARTSMFHEDIIQVLPKLQTQIPNTTKLNLLNSW